MNRPARFLRWIVVVCSAGVLPAFILDCDKALLIFQRGLVQSLGEDVGDLLFSQLSDFTQETQ